MTSSTNCDNQTPTLINYNSINFNNSSGVQFNNNIVYNNNISYQQQQQQQQQSVGCNLIDFSYSNLGCKINCDSPSFSDDYQVSNLLSENKVERDNGFIAAQFIKTPLDITISLSYPIDIERIGLVSKSGTGIIQSLSFYTSELTLEEIEANAKKMIENANSSNSNNNNNLKPTAMLSVNSQWDISKERYPNLQMKKQSITAQSSSLGSGGATNSNLVYNKLVHQAFKFVGHFDDLHQSPDKLFTYFCHPHFQDGHVNHQPLLNYLLPSQIKKFGSNVYLLNNIKSIRIRILKVFQSSCPSIGGIELWGLPSTGCPQNIVGQIYQKSIEIQSKKTNSNSFFPIYQQIPSTPSLIQTNKQSNQPQFSLPMSSSSFSSTAIPTSPPSIRSSTDSDMSDVDGVGTNSGSNHTDFDRFLEANPDIVLNEAGVPTIFLDPITLELMNDPVQLPSGKFVDRSTVQRLFDNHYFNDPFSGLRITDTQTNYELQQKIQYYHDSKKRKRLIKSRTAQVAVVNTSSLNSNTTPTPPPTPTNNTLLFSNLSISNGGQFDNNPFFHIGSHSNSYHHNNTNSVNVHHQHKQGNNSNPTTPTGFPHFNNFSSTNTTSTIPTNPFAIYQPQQQQQQQMQFGTPNPNPISTSHDSVLISNEKKGGTFGGRGSEPHPLLRLISQSSLVELPIKKIKK